MSRVVIIGGSGHVGTYLVPRLVEAGHEVICVSRGCCEAMYRWLGHEPKLEFMPFEQWKALQIPRTLRRNWSTSSGVPATRDRRPERFLPMNHSFLRCRRFKKVFPG